MVSGHILFFPAYAGRKLKTDKSASLKINMKIKNFQKLENIKTQMHLILKYQVAAL
ncbi:hypothetical protein HZC32_00425 [Candidatus Woesearchaeota archaeon]|nr:hypothetical protein [Candidatus Woesearchaeota archaeon]